MVSNFTANFVIVGIDPGLDVAGYSVVKHTDGTVFECAVKLLTSSSIEADPGTVDTRVRFLVNKFKKVIADLKHENEKVIIAIECPDAILYGRNPNRVNGVIKLIASAYGLFGGLIETAPTFSLKPRDWQPSKKKRIEATGIDDIKAWSLFCANKRLRAFLSDRPEFKKVDQDIADSLNITCCALGKILEGEWVI